MYAAVIRLLVLEKSFSLAAALSYILEKFPTIKTVINAKIKK